MRDSINFIDEVPNTYRAALQSPESSGWIAALAKEYTSLKELKALTLISKDKLPANTNIYHTRLLFTRKPPPLLYKARLCMRGDMEKIKLPLEDTFSTVIRTENLKLFLCLVLTLKWKFVTIDISTAFLNATLKRDLYIHIPSGHPDEDKRKTMCFKVHKALYGTVDAPKLWNDELNSTLSSMGYTRLKSD